jgi:hypothetical protein
VVPGGGDEEEAPLATDRKTEQGWRGFFDVAATERRRRRARENFVRLGYKIIRVGGGICI